MNIVRFFMNDKGAMIDGTHILYNNSNAMATRNGLSVHSTLHIPSMKDFVTTLELFTKDTAS